MVGAHVSLIYLRTHCPSTGEGHILAFLTGQDEIEKACALIKRAVEEDRVKGVPHQVREGTSQTT